MPDKCKDPSCDGEYHYEWCCKPGFVTDCCCQGQPQIKEDCPHYECPECGAKDGMIHWIKCKNRKVNRVQNTCSEQKT